MVSSSLWIKRGGGLFSGTLLIKLVYLTGFQYTMTSRISLDAEGMLTVYKTVIPNGTLSNGLEKFLTQSEIRTEGPTTVSCNSLKTSV